MNREELANIAHRSHSVAGLMGELDRQLRQLERLQKENEGKLRSLPESSP